MFDPETNYPGRPKFSINFRTLLEIVAAHYSQIFKIRNGYHWRLSVADSLYTLERYPYGMDRFQICDHVENLSDLTGYFTNLMDGEISQGIGCDN